MSIGATFATAGQAQLKKAGICLFWKRDPNQQTVKTQLSKATSSTFTEPLTILAHEGFKDDSRLLYEWSTLVCRMIVSRHTLGRSQKRQTFVQAIQADFSYTDIEIIAPACSYCNIWLPLRAKNGLIIQQTQHLQEKNWLRVIKSPNLATSQLPHHAPK